MFLHFTAYVSGEAQRVCTVEWTTLILLIVYLLSSQITQLYQKFRCTTTSSTLYSTLPDPLFAKDMFSLKAIPSLALKSSEFLRLANSDKHVGCLVVGIAESLL